MQSFYALFVIILINTFDHCIMMGKAPRPIGITKGLTLLFALTAAPAQMLAQSATTTAQPNDPVTFAELEGSVIEARVVRDQTMRRGHTTFPIRLQSDIKLVIGPDDRIQLSVTPTTDTPSGRHVGPTRMGPFLLEKTRPLPTLGGGEGVHLFKDGVLTFIRTYKAGAFKRIIAFSRTPDGLSCTIEENYAREDGVGEIAMNSAIDGGPVVLLSYKQISSTCHISKQSETPTAGDSDGGAIPNNK
jgi:hypothetical protein